MFGKLFNNLKNGLTKTKNVLTDKINETLKLAITIDEDLYEELEEILIMADIGMDTTVEIIDRLKDKIRKEKINRFSPGLTCVRPLHGNNICHPT